MLKPNDYSNSAEVKWCPSCGDYAILKHLQSAMAKSNTNPQNTVVVSGIGCASRLPYYMSTYGFHTVHGRALPIATGLKMGKSDTEVWVVTGDGDALSIGGNHYIHFFRRDLDINVLLFNNHVYGLTKGQYSPTSAQGQYSKSSPKGSTGIPINPLLLALTAGATFVSRTFDKDASNIQSIFIEAKKHRGASLVEILQNCPIFNDGVFDTYTERATQAKNTVRVVHGTPLVFGAENEWAIGIEGLSPVIKKISDMPSHQIWIHDQYNKEKAMLLTQLGEGQYKKYPMAMGVIYQNHKKPNELNTFDDYDTVLKNVLETGKLKFS